MKTKTNVWRAMVCAALAMVWASHTAKAGEPLCDYTPRKYAELKKDNYDGCVIRRDADRGGAIVLTDKSVFATVCPVTIKLNDHPTDCSDTLTDALKVNDVFRIDEWPGDHLQFTLVRGGNKVIVSGKLNPLVEEIDGSKRRLGYYLDTEVVSGGQKRKARYNIYLTYRTQNGKPVRYYSLEVFEDAEQCKEEMPNDQISAYDANCSQVAYPIPESGDDGQLPSGGGGEPPPKN